MRKKLYIGTSGYTYQHWKNVFYPPKLSPRLWLEHYTKHFTCVELNVTFYRLPKSQVFCSWRRRTPPGFRFVIKGSRYITHIKRLKGCAGALELFIRRAQGLGDKLAAILWQFPPSFQYDQKRLTTFVALLKKKAPGVLHAFEFRHASWFNQTTARILHDKSFSLCIADSSEWPSTRTASGGFLYLRFHGSQARYGSDYTFSELTQWRDNIKKWLRGRTVLFAFFNNDACGYAVKNAETLKGLLERKQ